MPTTKRDPTAACTGYPEGPVRRTHRLTAPPPPNPMLYWATQGVRNLFRHLNLFARPPREHPTTHVYTFATWSRKIREAFLLLRPHSREDPELGAATADVLSKCV